MADERHISKSGVEYVWVARRFTTPVNDVDLKEILVASDFVEVIVSDSRLLSKGSQFGHVAIDVDGVVYSRAHEEYVKIDRDVYFHGGMVDTTRGLVKVSGNSWRDSVGIVLRVFKSEKSILTQELERRVYVDRQFKRRHPDSSAYSLWDNSCSSNVADVLELIGILAHDPRWLPTPVSPKELLGVLEKSKRREHTKSYPKAH